MSKSKLLRASLVVLGLAFVLAPSLVLAALTDPTIPLGGSPITLTGGSGSLQDIIEKTARFLIVSGVVIAVIFIIWGGIAYMFVGGGDAKTALARIKNGVIGAAIVLGVGVILQTVAGLVSRNFFG